MSNVKIKLVELRNPGASIHHFLLWVDDGDDNALFHRLGAKGQGSQVGFTLLKDFKAFIAQDNRDCYYCDLDVSQEQTTIILQYLTEKFGSTEDYSLLHGPNCIDFITQALAVAGIAAPTNIAKAHRYYHKLCTRKLNLEEQTSNELV